MAGNFYTETLRYHPDFHVATRISDVAMLEAGTRARVLAIVKAAAAQGIDLIVFETYRSAERQAALFKAGATKLQAVGVHGFGLAADLVKRVQGEPSWKGDYSFLRELAEQNGLISGADWGQPNVKHTFVDADHVQRCALADQNSLFAGEWFPGDSYDPYRPRP